MATSVGIKMQMDGAAQFQADLKQITQKSKELAAEMKAAAAGEDNLADKQRILAAQMDNARAKIDKLTEKYRAQEKALQETKQQLEAAKKAYGEDSDQARKLTLEVTKQETALSKTKTEINKSTAELNKMEAQSKETTEETKDLTDAQEKAGQASAHISEGFTVLKGALANLAADGIRKAVDGFRDLMTSGPAFADEILTMASTTSLATDTLQELKYMSDLVDVDVSTVAGSMKKLTKNMDSARNGTGSAANAFKTLGVSVTDVHGNLRDNEDVFFDTIDALGGIENETERDALAMNIFGKSATDLNPMIEAGSDALKGFAEEAHDMGYVLDGNALRALGRVQDEFDRFKRQMESVKNQIAAGVAPAIERGMKRVQQIIASIDWNKVGKQIGKAFEALIDAFEWIVDNGSLIKGILTGIVTAMATQKIASFAQGIMTLASSLKAAMVAQEGFNVAANANPYMLLITVIVAAGAALMSWQKSLADATMEADKGYQATMRLTTSIEEHNAAIEETATAYAEQKASREESMNAGLAEMAHVQTLADELKTLTDENGRVADSDKARAQFILNELNGALGTEYTMTGNVIDQYSELQGAIDETIKKKQAEIVLQAQEEAYKQAIIGREGAEQQLYQATIDRINAENELAGVEARTQEILDEVSHGNTQHVSELDTLNARYKTLKGTLNTANKAYNKAADTVDQYAYDIESYTSNMTKALSGDYSTIEYKSWETAKAQGLASSEASRAVSTNATTAANAWMTNLGQMLTETTGKQIEFRDAGNGLVQMYANGIAQGQPMTQQQMQALNTKLQQEANKNYNNMKAAGSKNMEGMANGMKGSKWQTDNAIQNAVNSINSRAGSVNLWGTGQSIMSSLAGGLNYGANTVVYGALSALTANIPKWKGPQDLDKKLLTENGQIIMQSLVSGLKSGYSEVQNLLGGMTMDIGTYMNPRGASVVTDNRSNSYVINVYGAEGQDVQELADLVSERIQMTIERSEAVYA